MLNLRYYQRDAVDSAWRYLQSNHGNPLIVLPTGCHAKGTEILMYDGMLKLVEDVVVGDVLMGNDSTPRVVLQLARGKEEMYRILPTKGEPFVVNGNHILSLKSTNEGKKWNCSTTGNEIVNITVNDYLNKSKSWKHLYKLYRVPVHFKENRVLEPYMVGVFLGDGHIPQNNITSADNEIIDEVAKFADRFDCRVRTGRKKDNKACTLYLHPKKRGSFNYVSSFFKSIKINGLIKEQKHIPNAYKVACLKDRLALLAGLIDTDGSLHHCNGYDYVSMSKRLADDVVFVARSCGLAAYMKPCRKKSQNGTEGTYYRVSISGNCEIIPVKIKRKKSTKRLQKKSHLKTGFKIEKIGVDDFYGFSLSGNHLYLTSDFIVHHNTGKTLCVAQIIEEAMQYDQARIIVATHVKELVQQNYEEYIGLSPFAPAGIYSAGLNRRDHHARILFAGIQSIYNKAEKLQRCDLLLIDECHTIAQKDDGRWRTFLGHMQAINRGMRIIGLTATPYRLDSGMLTTGENKIFDDICYEYPLLRAIEDGYLCPIVPTTMATRYDLSNVRTLGGDYKQDELEAAFNIDEKTMRAIDEIEAYGQDRRSWLIFAAGNNHAYAIHEELKKRGYLGAVVTKDTNNTDRDKATAEIKNYKIRYLVNNKVFTTGFNAKNIDLIADFGATKSAGLHVQKLGRGTRTIGANIEQSIANGKSNCVLLDFARNVDYHGPLDKIRGRDKSSKGDADAPVKVCPQCNQVCFAGLRTCFKCGYEFPFDEQSKIRTDGGDNAILSTQIEPEWHKVASVAYDLHQKEGKTPSMRVSYFTFNGIYREWICFEHSGFAKKKAQTWHMNRLFREEIPITIDAALKLKYPNPTKILVLQDGKYPQILDYDFKTSTNEEEVKTYKGMDDDEDYIPF